MPNLTARICGVCPEAHHMASTKALDALFQVEPPPTAKKLRELLYSIFVATDHTTHFYALGGPDFVVGPDAPPAERNILGVVQKVGMEIGLRVIKMRRDGHELIKMIGGRPVHPNWGVPGGVSRGITEAQRAEIERLGRAGRRVRPVLARVVRRHRAGQRRVRRTDQERCLRPQDLRHGYGRRERPRQLLRRPDPRHRSRRQASTPSTTRATTASTWPSTSSPGPTSSSRT